MYISIQEFCVWLVVKYDLDRNWTHYHHFYQFCLPMVKLSFGELNLWPSDHLVAVLSTTLIWLLTFQVKFLDFNWNASGANTMHMLHGYCTHSKCMWTSPYTHPKHAIYMSQTCFTQAAHALHTCHLHAIHRRHTFHMYTFMNAQAYCTTCKNATSSMHIQPMHTRCKHDPHKKHSSCTHGTLTCITYATYITYTSML